MIVLVVWSSGVACSGGTPPEPRPSYSAEQLNGLAERPARAMAPAVVAPTRAGSENAAADEADAGAVVNATDAAAIATSTDAGDAGRRRGAHPAAGDGGAPRRPATATHRDGGAAH
jgi:hypothetical protein